MSGQPMNVNIYRSERDTRGIVYASIETTGTEFSIVKSCGAYRRSCAACLQELKAAQEKFPEAAIHEAGYGVIWHPVADARGGA